MNEDSGRVDPLDDLRYREAMATFRSVMAASVSTATALFAGTLTLLGFAVDGDVNGWLILLSAAPMLAMAFLFYGWQWYNERVADEAGQIVPDGLPDDLRERPGSGLLWLPIGVAAVIVTAGVAVLVCS